MFYLGSYLGYKIKLVKLKYINLKSNQFNILLPVITFFLIYFIISLKSYFFTGYLSTLSTSSEKGPFVLFTMSYFTIFFYDAIKNTNRSDNLFFNIFFSFRALLYWSLSLLILSLGGRLYFLTSIIAFFLFYTNFVKKIKWISFFLYMTVIVCPLLVWGVLRSNQNFTFDLLLFTLSAEPIFTSFSLLTFLDNNPFIFFEFPQILASQLINFVPHFILPNKSEYMITAQELGYIYEKPIGAQNIYVSLMINFGIIFSFLFFLFLGFFLSYIKRLNSIFFRVTYCLFVSYMAFSLFRDSFQVSLIKNIIQCCFITLSIYISLGYFLFYLFPKIKNH